MNDYLPDAVNEGLKAARRASMHRGERLCVHDGDQVYRIGRFWHDGMTLDAQVSDKLRGRVDIYDGARHLYQALITGSRIDGDDCVFSFKWLQPVRSSAAADYAADRPAPAGLITIANP